MVPRLPNPPGLKRLAGGDRYATAGAIVQDSYATGSVPLAFIAAGETFADAPAGGPAADRLGGPVLPVTRTSIPPPVQFQLTRLQPQRIVILGGTSAISAAVAAQLDTYSAGPVTRIAGSSRYGTVRYAPM